MSEIPLATKSYHIVVILHNKYAEQRVINRMERVSILDSLFYIEIKHQLLTIRHDYSDPIIAHESRIFGIKIKVV